MEYEEESDDSGFYNDSDYYHYYYDYVDQYALSEGMASFYKTYGKIHGPLSLIICLFGITANIFNVIVLTRKNMRSPTNTILTALGITDILALASYLLFILYAYIFSQGVHYTENYHKGWIDYSIIMTHISSLFEINGMWLTIALAVFQYVSVCHINIANRLCTLRNSKITILLVGVVSLVMAIPLFILYETKELPPTFSVTNSSIWYLGDSRIVEDAPELKDLYLVFYGIIAKLTSYTLLIVLSALLLRLRALKKVVTRKENLFRHHSEERRKDDRSRIHFRTTIMLLTVVVVLVLAQLPKVIMALIGGISKHIFLTVTIPLDDFFILLTLINNAVKFILYCVMSQQFRMTFSKLFLKKPMRALGAKRREKGITSTSCPGKTGFSEETHL